MVSIGCGVLLQEFYFVNCRIALGELVADVSVSPIYEGCILSRAFAKVHNRFCGGSYSSIYVYDVIHNH